MDPITKMAQDFMGSWQRFRQSAKIRLCRIDTHPSMHRDLARIFRALEMSQDNRSPYFLFDQPFSNRNQYYAAAIQKLAADYAAIREGLGTDGVEIGELTLSTTDIDQPESAFAQTIEAIWALTKPRFDSLMLIFLPSAIGDKAEWPETIEKLALLFSPSRFRVAVADTPEELLAGVCSRIPRQSLSITFFIAENALQEYLHKLAAGAWEALSGEGDASGKESAKEAQSNEATNVIAAEGAARLRVCLAKATTAAAESNVEESLRALREAKAICKVSNLAVHEAILAMAIANTFVAAEQNLNALENYGIAIEIADSAQSPVVTMQARLGAASTWFRMGNYSQAGEVYEQAAKDAHDAQSDILRIEALRMAGTCQIMENRPDEAARCWSQAIAIGSKLPSAEVSASTFHQVGDQFISLCKERGLTKQADSIAQQIKCMLPGNICLPHEQAPVATG